jgi:hypothetical protein
MFSKRKKIVKRKKSVKVNVDWIIIIHSNTIGRDDLKRHISMLFFPQNMLIIADKMKYYLQLLSIQSFFSKLKSKTN